MKYGLTISDAGLAKSPKIGVETRLKYSVAALIKQIAVVELSAAAVGLLDLDETFEALTVGGANFQCVLLTANPAAVATVLTFAVVYSDGAVGTATATFTPPAYAADQGEHMPQGIAVDLVPGEADETFRSVTSLTSVAGGAAGVKFAIVQMPDTANWNEIRLPVMKNVALGGAVSVPIADRYDPVANLKKGRGDIPTLSLSAKYATLAMGLGRLNGHRAVIMFETYDNDSHLSERIVCQTILKLNIPRGEANEEVVVTGEGIAEKLAVFV